MKQIKQRGVAVVAGAALWGTCGASLAMGLGKPHSHAILGEELSITVPVRLDAGERLDDECVAADVFYGDEKVAASQVRARVGADADGSPVVHISTRNRVTEPVVTVYVAAGCQSRITRKILALADPPGLQLPAQASVGLASAQAVHQAAAAMANATAASSQRTVVMGSSSDAASDAPRRDLASTVRSKRTEAGQRAPHQAAVPDDRDAVRARGREPTGRGDDSAAHAADARDRLRLLGQARISAPPDAVRDPREGLLQARKGGPAAAVSAAVNRLELDPVAADAQVSPALKMGASLAAVPDADAVVTPELLARRASAAAHWRALQATPEQLARDQERLQQLEQRVAALQAQVELASAASAASTLAPALAASVPSTVAEVAPTPSRVTPWLALAAALGVAGAYVVWRSRTGRAGAQSAWWHAPAHETESPGLPAAHERGHDPGDLHSTTVDFVHVPHEASAPAVHVAATAAASAMAPVASPLLAPLAATATNRLPEASADGAVPQRTAGMFTSLFGALGTPGSSGDDSMRAVAVEELIDLEQQAEFFVVLGQDDAAIDLLEVYVQHNPLGSPLPLLKLLEIYRRLGRREDYERTCQSFDARFNAHAPGWSEDMQHGLSLADYPEVVERLQALWPEPAQAMAVLEKSLLRPTSGGDTFDLPAYRELLTLYAVARDLAEGVAGAQRVDVLLPLNAADLGAAEQITSRSPAIRGAQPADVSPLMATRPVKAQPVPALAHGVSVDLEVDLQLDDEPRRV